MSACNAFSHMTHHGLNRPRREAHDPSHVCLPGLTQVLEQVQRHAVLVKESRELDAKLSLGCVVATWWCAQEAVLVVLVRLACKLEQPLGGLAG